MAIFSDGLDLNLPPAPIKTLNRIIPAKGDEICYYGAYSSLVCGELLLTPKGGGEDTRTNPWSRIPQTDQFLRVGIVGLRSPPYFPLINSAWEDYGGPVFKPVYCNEDCDPNSKRIIAAHPVGLLLNSKPLMPLASFPGLALTPEGLDLIISVFVTYFTYQSLELIMANEPNLSLLTSPEQPNLAERGC